MLERPRAEDPYKKLPPLPTFSLTSADIRDDEPIPIRHAALGAGDGALNLSPHLAWTGDPEDTRSFVVSCFDPDAPTPSGFWHWTMIDVPVDITELATGGPVPQGAVVLKSDLGVPGYNGPQPPSGDVAHRYFFVVHAVRVPTLDLGPDTTPVVASFYMQYHACARAQIVPTLAL
jgi:Raf kinase inhibitor-like YbhB/YbcL family protein